MHHDPHNATRTELSPELRPGFRARTTHAADLTGNVADLSGHAADLRGHAPETTMETPNMQMPQSRYVLPSFVEHSSFGAKESNPYNKLFEERIIFLGSQVDDTAANDIMAQLLVLEGLDPDRDITMYINSPGGSFTSLMGRGSIWGPSARVVALSRIFSSSCKLPGKLYILRASSAF